MESPDLDPYVALVAVSREVLERAVHDEEQALHFLESLRWPDGLVCPKCSSTRTFRVGGKVSEARHVRGCLDCSGQFNWKSGSRFQGSRNTARQVLTVALLRSEGLPSPDVVARIEQLFGFGRPRAQRLVSDFGDIELQGARPAAEEPEAHGQGIQRPVLSETVLQDDSSDDGAEAESLATADETLVIEQDVPALPLPSSLASEVEAVGHGRSRLYLLIAAAVLLAALGATSIFSGVVRANEPLREWHLSWQSGGERIDITSERQPGETRAQWARRFDSESAAMLAEFPPD